ncbi:MAG: ABC-F family ATP-binding cassette domain-containing protein [Eubacterium sp.]|nr:ABC-F family ATP-binding cassette domain-containing protein [Eubacterium sp.]
MSVVSVQNLTLSFGENTLFKGVSFDIYEKDKVGFVGANGAGKTSLFKVLKGEYLPDSGGCFIGKNVKIGYMEQHTCSNNKTVYDELISVFNDLIKMEKQLEDIAAELTQNATDELIAKQDFLTNEFQANGGLTYKSLTRSSLIGLGFDEKDFDMPTSKLSGGQKSKLILAKLLLSKADLLLLDEPTNHLDISAVEWLESFLSSFSGAFIVISHDRYFLDKVTDKTIEIENNKLRSYKGNYSEFLVKKEAEQKAIEEKYELDLKEIERLEGIIAQQRQWNREKNIKTAESKEKVIERIKAQMVVPDAKVQKIRFDFTPKCVSGDDVLDVFELSKSFGDKKIFENVSFQIKKGQRVFLLGDNGCGKTTLLKILMQDYFPESGKFKFGANLFTGYFDQVQAKLDLSKTAIDEVWSAFPHLTETRVRNALAAFLFKGDEVYKVLEKCSGGERARIALLKLMLGQFNFLLLDEPTNHLDAFSREELENTLLNYSGTMLIVSHDRYFINKLATSIIELTPNGVNTYLGNYDDYAEKRFVAEEKTKKEKPVKVNDYKLKKERASALRKLNTRLSRLEEEIEQAEEKTVMLEESLSANPPYEELLEITKQLEEITAKRDALYEEWEQVSEELTSLSD